MKKHVTPSPTAILKKHGKSFYWASIFLGKNKALQAARLYAFCRKADDLADRSPRKNDIGAILNEWKKQLRHSESNTPEIKDILELMREIHQDTHALEHLLEGLISDLTLTQLADQTQLLQYCYLVAGTVGLMMCGLLGAEDKEAKHFAVDLGIAMQLTNILRDVREDAAVGRQYIPQSWLMAEINFFQPNAKTNELAKPIFQRLHNLAEVYYKSAYAGMIYLPWRSRLSIMIAARLYQEIGLQAKSEGFPVLHKRIIISPMRKCQLVLRSLLQFNWDLFKRKKLPIHDSVLHHAIASWKASGRIETETSII